MEDTVSPKQKTHYAWFVCAGCFLIFFITGGMTGNNMSIFYPFIREKYSFSNTMISLLSTAKSIGNLLALAAVPAYYRRLDLRKGILGAMGILVVALLMYAWARSFPVFFVANILTGAAYGLTCMVPLSILIDRWFVKDRALVVSVVCMGSGLATMGIPSLMTYILKNCGISTMAYLELGFIVILAAAALLLIRNRPEEKGIRAYGTSDEESAAAGSGRTAEKKAYAEKNGIRVYSRIFKGKTMKYFPVYLVAICCGLGCGTAYANISLLAISAGHTVETAALAMSVVGIMLTFGKLFFGGISEKFGVRRPTIIISIIWVIGMGLLCFCGLGKGVLYTGCVLSGMGTAMTMVCMVLWPLDWADGFERDIMKQRMQVAYSAGGLAFSVVPGITADLSGGSYVPVYIFFTFVIALLTFLLIRNYRQAEQNL